MKENIMKEKYPKYKKHYDVALKIIVAFVCIGMFVWMHGEDWSFRLLFTAVLTVAAFVFTLLTRKISFRILMFGDSLKKTWQKIVFYVVMPIAAFGVYLLIVYGLLFIFDARQEDKHVELASALSDAIMFMLLDFVLVIGIYVPYVQTILVLILRKFIRVKSY